MTAQTKHYIELSDIVSLRLVCKRCDTNLTFRLSDQIDARCIRVCPQCNEPWTKLPSGSTIENAVVEHVGSIKRLGDIVHRWSEQRPDSGFSLTLEVKADVINLKALT